MDAVYLGWGRPDARPLREVSAAGAAALSLPAGSMGPKVAAAAAFATRTGRPAVIGALDRIVEMADGTAGTRVVP